MQTKDVYNYFMKVIVASPRGFCAGVVRAIDIVLAALKKFGAPVYVRHEIVHNRFVVETLKAKGVIFVEELHKVPKGAVTIFSAHGVSRAVVEEAKERGLLMIDATCPLVAKVHMEVVTARRQDLEVIVIGHKGHPEIAGTMGQAEDGLYLVETVEDASSVSPQKPDHLTYVTQTTLSVDETHGIVETLKKRFPNITAPKKDDICYATQNRQDAVKALAKKADLVLVVGSPNSSNSRRLVEVANNQGVRAYLIEKADDIQIAWLAFAKTVGVTAGASAPEVLVQQVIEWLKNQGATTVEELKLAEENTAFSLPPSLRAPASLLD